jgi:hypothetical protein
MNIKHDELSKNGYELHEQFSHNDIALFIQPYVFKKNKAIVFYWIFNLILLSSTLIKIFTTEIGIGKSFGLFALGLAGMIPIIPIHELIHGLLYKIDGAKSVQYKANFKKFIFYAMADKYVVSFSSFVTLALAPFIIINTILLLFIFLSTSSVSFFLAGLLFIHTAGCSGDFALISYFIENGGNSLVTYDDTEKGLSYFFKKQVYS